MSARLPCYYSGKRIELVSLIKKPRRKITPPGRIPQQNLVRGQRRRRVARVADYGDSRFGVATSDEGRRIFDEAARHFLNLGGDEFIRRWDAGEFAGNVDQPDVMAVALLLPFVR